MSCADHISPIFSSTQFLLLRRRTFQVLKATDDPANACHKSSLHKSDESSVKAGWSIIGKMVRWEANASAGAQ